jgi:hypothetical protein
MLHRWQKRLQIRLELLQVKPTSGTLTAINETGQFVGNVSETVVENPVVANTTEETQFFSDKSK